MEQNMALRVTVVRIEDTYFAHATVVAGSGGGKHSESAMRRTKEVALMECFAKLVGKLVEEEEVEDGLPRDVGGATVLDLGRGRRGGVGPGLGLVPSAAPGGATTPAAAAAPEPGDE